MKVEILLEEMFMVDERKDILTTGYERGVKVKRTGLVKKLERALKRKEMVEIPFALAGKEFLLKYGEVYVDEIEGGDVFIVNGEVDSVETNLFIEKKGGGYAWVEFD